MKTSFQAKRIGFLLLDGFSMIAFSNAVEVFRMANYVEKSQNFSTTKSKKTKKTKKTEKLKFQKSEKSTEIQTCGAGCPPLCTGICLPPCAATFGLQIQKFYKLTE